MTRQLSVTGQVDLVTEVCCDCGITFAMPEQLQTRCLAERGPNGRQFWCPNGHQQYYTGESDAARLRRQLTATESQLTHERDQRQAAERSARGHRAAHTRTKRRLAAGVCPCCRRSFADLARHMAGQHPEYAHDAAAGGDT